MYHFLKEEKHPNLENCQKFVVKNPKIGVFTEYLVKIPNIFGGCFWCFAKPSQKWQVIKCIKRTRTVHIPETVLNTWYKIWIIVSSQSLLWNFIIPKHSNSIMLVLIQNSFLLKKSRTPTKVVLVFELVTTVVIDVKDSVN